jgi:hypothetical protein
MSQLLLEERLSAIEAAITASVALPKAEGGKALSTLRLTWATDPAWYGALKEDYPDALMTELELAFRSYMVITVLKCRSADTVVSVLRCLN